MGDERVKLLGSRVVAGTGTAGHVLSGFTIACGDSAVEVTVAQRAGKRAMPAKQALLGLDLGVSLS